MVALPYLNFDGDCRQAFELYQRVFGGRLEITTHADSPIADEVPEAWGERIMHARLTHGDFVLMASDTPPDHFHAPRGMHVSLHLEDPDEAERIFRELAEDGTVTMPMETTFWAKRFGMLTDRFGIPWMVNCAAVGEEG